MNNPAYQSPIVIEGQGVLLPLRTYIYKSCMKLSIFQSFIRYFIFQHSLPMLKLITFTFLLSLSMIASSCETVCSHTSQRDGRCYYTCQNKCRQTASQNTQKFLHQLSAKTTTVGKTARRGFLASQALILDHVKCIHSIVVPVAKHKPCVDAQIGACATMFKISV
jgi:YHS domain-containing protein